MDHSTNGQYNTPAIHIMDLSTKGVINQHYMGPSCFHYHNHQKMLGYKWLLYDWPYLGYSIQKYNLLNYNSNSDYTI